ncbi:DHH family phosphoesterase [Aneurinibacillus tyrosinisolvens]|uniref:DHH family phosphoesterase n=1 Tax=Aneurinibacillus tyrosinisolvens TaxID=1443435 RepID=UPI00063F6E4C|nr:DHHA1 domain-containing protein [Aneurinibacillus tyrosinisolvens]
MDYILITHNDLDGTVPVILAKIAIPNVTYFQCSYEEVNNTVQSIIERDKTTFLFIVDISINAIIAEKLNNRGNVVLLDHHKTSTWLAQYNWARIDITKSASFIFYEFLKSNFPNCSIEKYSSLVERTNDYDLWIHQYKESMDLNEFLSIVGHDLFIKRFLKDSSINFTQEEKLILETEQRRKISYFEEVTNKTKTFTENGYKYGVCFSDRYHSELGNTLLENLQIDYVYIVDFLHNKVSLRSKGEIDVSQIALKHNGGGHKNASGFPLKKEIVDDLINNLINPFRKK